MTETTREDIQKAAGCIVRHYWSWRAGGLTQRTLERAITLYSNV